MQSDYYHIIFILMLKNTLSLIIISFCYIYTCIAQTTRTVKQDEILKGQVMQVSQINLQMNGTGVLDTIIKSTTRFDKRGNVVESVVYVTNSVNVYTDKKTTKKFIIKYDNQYNAQGYLKQVDVYQDTVKQNTITYDENGNMQENKLLYNNLKTHYKYTPDNYIAQTIHINAKGDTTLSIKYTYNQRRNLVTTHSHAGHEEYEVPTYYTYKTYDAKGNWTMRIEQTDYKTGTLPPEIIQERTYIYY